MLEHGGRLRTAAKQYGIAVQDWLDLSTGINPNGWPVPAIPASCWHRLPEDDDGLEQAACDYYGAESLLAVAGSQAAIQALPRLRKPCRVGVISPGYAEHAYAWQRAGHQVIAVDHDRIGEIVTQLDVLLLIHPNNPTGARYSRQHLLDWHQMLSARSGWLVVDEAFMDITPEHSLVPLANREGLIVLRSLGKFFGLAGARIGFVCAQTDILQQLKSCLGPWTISGAARWLARQALYDRHWQQSMRQTLLYHGERLQALLARYELMTEGGCVLFHWVKTDAAAQIHSHLARQGILTRLFSEPASLRFGLPATEADWQRLESALQQLTPLNEVPCT